MKEGNLKRYFFYAIGEILLVMIGILLALQVNNWNEADKEKEKIHSFLSKLKEDIEADIDFIEGRDAFFAKLESNSEQAIEKFYQAQTIEDLRIVDSLFNSQWNDLRINKSVYNEMLSTGSIYKLKNKELQYRLTNYYSFIESHQYYIKEVNENSLRLRNSELLVPFHYLIHAPNDVNKNEMNTDWIGGVHSPTFLALHKFYIYTQNSSNTYRREIFKRVLARSQDLVDEIEKEIHKND